MQTPLAAALHANVGVPLAQLDAITAFFQPVLLKKGDFFQKSERGAHQLGFLQSGFIREYFVDGDGQEVTKWIGTPGHFIVDLTSFMFDQPARWNYQALTDCQMQVVSKAQYRQIRQNIPIWPEIERLFVAKCFAVLEHRIVTHLSMSSEARYRYFFDQNPELFNQVPLQYLASMLGMTPETFSRIRKKHSQKTS